MSLQIQAALLYRPDGIVKKRTVMASEKVDTRQKILTAAGEIARQSGPGNLSLDAVAAHAGVSKGGLLYHFPSKSRLLEALVDEFMRRFEAELEQKGPLEKPNSVIDAYMDHFVKDCRCGTPPSTGIVAALAEDPGMLEPVRRYERRFLTRIRDNAVDPQMATIAFLAINGIRSMDLLSIPVLEGDEMEDVLNYLRTRLAVES